MKNSSIPDPVKATLWSYNIDEIDLDDHRDLLVSQVLNYGNEDATKWLFSHYGFDQVRESAKKIPRGGWDKKSLALWSLYLNIDPKPRAERILK